MAKPKRMTAKQFCDALHKLDLGHGDYASVAALGIQKRQILRLTGGHRRVSPTIERLLFMYQQNGIPKQYQPQ